MCESCDINTDTNKTNWFALKAFRTRRQVTWTHRKPFRCSFRHAHVSVFLLYCGLTQVVEFSILNFKKCEKGYHTFNDHIFTQVVRLSSSVKSEQLKLTDQGIDINYI